MPESMVLLLNAGVEADDEQETPWSRHMCSTAAWGKLWQGIIYLLTLLVFSFSALTLLVRNGGADTMSIKQKTTKTLGFPVVLWHYRLSGRKDIRLIKMQWLFQLVSPLWEYQLTQRHLKKGRKTWHCALWSVMNDLDLWTSTLK